MSTTGKVAGVNPEAFKIIDSKLYLSWDTDSAGIFAAAAATNIKKADESWRKLNN
jgi:hypothetical protein